jgi:CRP-like cAMP-binding protein
MNPEATEVGGWELFAGMAPGDVEVVLAACRPLVLVAGEPVVSVDQANDALHLVRSGRVEVFKAIRGNADRVLESFGAGDVLGILSFLDGSRPAAGVRATEPTELLVLTRAAFERVRAERPDVAAPFYRNLAAVMGGHLRSTLELYRQAVEFGLEATGAAALSLGHLVEGLRDTTLHLTGGATVTGRLLQLDQNPAGFTLVVKDGAGKLSVVPYHAIQRIEVG